jgi:hypothetical protein
MSLGTPLYAHLCAQVAPELPQKTGVGQDRGARLEGGLILSATVAELSALSWRACSGRIEVDSFGR